ncbi:Glycosyltransferase involved in cell wall bisynthesis [Parapedobacter luteus]|uniref:Glycosyltransferase involved in cell wall bisynthesis n=1 Tax=Parapedobacter luteus TaxID=623280 RepID=A0A1T5DG75_9SPHI|nr:glycosyltransferase [Parapedobacter luteus]SKB70676.1 Glycosyltransferase involved in cell wall bisynthesis [Parapedobacter luteus]
MANLPFVSVIIPVFNNAVGLFKTLSRINQQHYPKDRYEVIVVDNGSIDAPEKIAKAFGATFLREIHHLNSPYSARNRGLEIAKGSILILLDTTCQPIEQWMVNGIKDLRAKGVDLIAGNVAFAVDHNSSIGEIYDSVSNIKMRELVENRGMAAGCNLFVKREVFECIGHFEEGLRSGGDLRWTKKATENGFKLSYSNEAKVLMTPKKFKALLLKAIRVSKGHPRLWLEEKVFLANFIKRVLLFWLPPNPLYLKKNIANSSFPEAKRYFVLLYLIRYLFRLISIIGFIQGGLLFIQSEKK